MNQHESPLILIVERDRSAARRLAEQLEELSIKTEFTDDTAQALEMVKRKYYNLVIAELMMDGMKGTELIDKIKEFDPGLSVIIVTTYMNAYVGMSCQKHGAAGIFPKPYKFDRLLNVVIKALRY